MEYKNLKMLRILFLKIWVFHIFVFYNIYGFLLIDKAIWVSRNTLDMILIFLTLPVGGILGINDHFVLFFIFPIVIMALLLKYTHFSFYKSYVISIVSGHVIRVSIQYILYPYENLIYTEINDKLTAFLYLIISLILTALLNYFVFHKNYKRLEFN